jgi:hypothetical protein
LAEPRANVNINRPDNIVSFQCRLLADAKIDLDPF